MSPLVVLLAASLPAVPPESVRPLPLRLERGQEFVYQARHSQGSDRPGSRTGCTVESRVLVLDHTPQGTLAAFMTSQHFEGAAAPVARLELGRIDPMGRVTLVDSSHPLPRLPVDGAPALETLPFLELPHVEPSRPWEVADRDLGPQTWRVLVTAGHRHGQCLKLKGEQASAGRTPGGLVWRREDLVWMLQYDGCIVRSERHATWQTETGETWRSETVTDLIDQPGSMPPQQLADRRAEITEALRLGKELAELLKPRGEPNLRGYDDLLRAIDRRRDLGTPYAAAIHTLRRRAEQARRGERPPAPVVIAMRDDAKPALCDVGDPAPDLTLTPLAGGRPLALASLRGKPAVLVFFKPSSALGGRVAEYVRDASAAYRDRVPIIPLACEPASLPATYDGRAALAAFAGTSTPRVVVLDAAGTVRVIAPGWGGEFPDWIHKELLAILKEWR